MQRNEQISVFALTGNVKPDLTHK